MKKLPLLLCSTVAITAALPSFAESGRTDYDTNKNGLIEINDLADLDEIRNNLDGTTFYKDEITNPCPNTTDGCHGFELMADLDFDTNGDGKMDENDTYWNEGEGWEPIGDESDPFQTEFNGNNHSIQNLYINKTSTDYIGLFSYTTDTSISNLEISGNLVEVRGVEYLYTPMRITDTALISGHSINTIFYNIITEGKVYGDTNVSGLVGGCTQCNISRITSKADVNGLVNVGGIAGGLENSAVSESSASGIITGVENIGGVAGVAYIDSRIDNLYFLGTTIGILRAGGIVGQLDGNSSIHNTYSLGSVNINSESEDKDLLDVQYLGGLVGYIRNSHLENSFTIGSISSINYYNTNYVGSLVGYAESSTSISNNYWATNSTLHRNLLGGDDTTTILTDNAGVTLEDLRCPTSADDTDCLPDTTLFAGWGGETYVNDAGETVKVWDFGTDKQLPALNMNGEIYRDTDGDGVPDDKDHYPYDPDRYKKSSSSGGGSVFWLLGLAPLFIRQRRAIQK